VTLRVHPDEIVAKSSSGMLATHRSWERVRLDHIATVLNGYAFPSTGFGKVGDMPLIRIRDVGRESTDTWYTGAFEPQYVIEQGSLIVGMDGEFRVDTWRGPPSLLNQRVCKIEVRNPALYSESFLRWALPGYLEAVHRETSSVTVRHLSSQTIKELPLPLPPIAEQERIVTAIEEQFSRLDAGMAALEQAHAKLNRLRYHGILSLIQGSGQRECLGDVAEVRLGRQRSPRNHTGPNMYPYLRAANVTWNGLDLSDVKEMNFSRAEMSTYALKAGDVLVAEASGSASEVGKPAIWDGSIPNCCFQNTLLRLRSNHLTPDYLYYVLLALARSGAFARASKGVGIHHLSKGGLTKLEVEVPPIATQQALVGAIRDQQERLSDVEKALVIAVKRVGRLRASILSAAFSGKLVPQKLNDESATVLLDRIASQQASSNGRKPVRTSRHQASSPDLGDVGLHERRLGIQLMWEDGYSKAEIAETMEISPTQMSSEMTRMRHQGWDLPKRRRKVAA
jgi:type I restriction enzyme, S subunit